MCVCVLPRTPLPRDLTRVGSWQEADDAECVYARVLASLIINLAFIAPLNDVKLSLVSASLPRLKAEPVLKTDDVHDTEKLI